MSVLYLSEYVPVSDSVREVSEQEHALGRALLFRGLSELYQLNFDPADEALIIAADKNGKPYLRYHPEICFNITHCSGLVACAFHDAPVGIDAELPGYFAEVLIGRALSGSEKSLLMSCNHDEDLRRECFWRLWTLKEAYVKRSGIGVDTDLKAFSFAFDAFSTPDVGKPVKVACSDPSVSCFQLFLKSGHIVSLCTGRAKDESLLVFDIIENIDLCQGIYDNNNSEDYPHR